MHLTSSQVALLLRVWDHSLATTGLDLKVLGPYGFCMDIQAWWFQELIPGQATSVSPRNLLEMQRVHGHTGLAESELQDPQGTVCALKYGKHWSRPSLLKVRCILELCVPSTEPGTGLNPRPPTL